MKNTMATLQRARQTLGRALLSGLLLGFVLLCALPGALAQRSELQSALQQAQISYDDFGYGEAERQLEDAIGLAERLGLEQDPVVAQLYLFLGVVRHTTSGEGPAELAFIEALKIDPNAFLNPDYATPVLNQILDRARASVPQPVNPVTPIEPTPVVGRELEHAPVTTANAGVPLTFTAKVAATVPLYRMQLSYRRYGERSYSTIEMNPSDPTTFRVQLPGSEIYSSQLDYFIEALDRTGGILVATGGPLSPLNVIVFGGEGYKPPPGGHGPKAPEQSGPRQYVFAQVLAGGGIGLATGTPVVMTEQEVNTGVAPAPFHVLAELGIMITNDLHLSGFYRKQIVEEEDLFGAKLRWWFDNEGPWRSFTGVGGGYGYVRHTVDLRPAVEFVDTTREGDKHGGVSVGFGYAFNDHVMFVTEFYTMILFPEISVHLDGNMGFRVSF